MGLREPHSGAGMVLGVFSRAAGVHSHRVSAGDGIAQAHARPQRASAELRPETTGTYQRGVVARIYIWGAPAQGD